jgi:hypothetical protein
MNGLDEFLCTDMKYHSEEKTYNKALLIYRLDSDFS